MVCENFRVRSRKYKKYYFCTNSKKEITFDACKNCSCCTYKKTNKLKVTSIKVKNKKSSRLAKATEITKEVRQTVAIRDNGRCIICNKNVSVLCSNAHFIKRSQRRLRHKRKYCYIMSRLSL